MTRPLTLLLCAWLLLWLVVLAVAGLWGRGEGESAEKLT